jgi:hypothetical protein
MQYLRILPRFVRLSPLPITIVSQLRVAVDAAIARGAGGINAETEATRASAVTITALTCTIVTGEA